MVSSGWRRNAGAFTSVLRNFFRSRDYPNSTDDQFQHFDSSIEILGAQVFERYEYEFMWIARDVSSRSGSTVYLYVLNPADEIYWMPGQRASGLDMETCLQS